MERHVADGKGVWTNQIINSEEGSKNVDNIDYNEENTIHITNKGNLHSTFTSLPVLICL